MESDGGLLFRLACRTQTGAGQESVHVRILTSQREIKEDYWVACSHG
jgi:hypothetical protein